MTRFLPNALVAAGLCLFSYSSAAQAPVQSWNKTFGGNNADNFATLRQTREGGFILGGSSYSGATDDKTQPQLGAADYWVVKLDASGTAQWDRTIGTSGREVLSSLQQTSDGGYILGGNSDAGIDGDRTQPSKGNADYWIVKLDGNGNKLWDRAFGSAGEDFFCAIQQTSDGGYILGGSSAGTGGDKSQPGQNNGTTLDYWIIKLDASGNKQWDKTFGGRGIDILFGLQQTSDGGYILGGESASDISGDKTQPSQGEADCWVVKLDASGTKQWDRAFGGNRRDALTALQQTTDGGYVFGATSSSGIIGDKSQPLQGFTDCWVVKLDASGTKQWDRAFGGNRPDFLNALQQTTDGGYVLGASSSSGISGDKSQASRGDHDYWVLKLDASGTKQWDSTFGGSEYDYLFSLQQTTDGYYVLGGTSRSSISGDKTQANRGSNDYWVVKLGAVPLANVPVAAHSTLAAFPNPTTATFTLSGPLGTPYQLLNQLGQVVRAGRVSAQPLQVQALPAGLYLLRDQVSGHTIKLVKE